MKILITGSIGFIGFSITKSLLKNDNNNIIGIDNISDYYDVNLKKNRLDYLLNFKNFSFKKIDISNTNELNKLDDNFDLIIHLAAQAGVNYSFKFPEKYISTNIIGFNNILNIVKKTKSKFIYASSSSVYGNNNVPFRESMLINKPINLYASTKIYNEAQASSYSQNYDLDITGLRFFTVYGPWGRPDMFIYKAIESAFSGKKLFLFNDGNNFRDFTYIDDIVTALNLVIDSDKKNENEIFNISNGKKYKIKQVIKIIESITKQKINIINKIKIDGDMEVTYGGIEKIKKFYGYKPKIGIEEGIDNYVAWFKKYFKI